MFNKPNFEPYKAKREYPIKYFSYFSMKTYVVGTH